ncbi:hypothetical protein GPECTOR_22g885 [Gonium pectorale]|uniref:Alpha 1,4-glycosyltransferase domain-containing protein n=1 Tax=Gonium pectorale TaxID=33097 RepID=A0A150GHG7_GONPE|nr:hypothetical protein GPECTOR_22g885 [Gonium pectorale]|eukprot:KXZ49291.1 hypothetical protein GPECTOR_22g885 [Gonium pectorale]
MSTTPLAILYLLYLLAVVLPQQSAAQDGLALSGKPFDAKRQFKTHTHLIYFYLRPELRRLCALESTLRSNPEALVHVHTSDALDFVRRYNKTALKSVHPDRVINNGFLRFQPGHPFLKSAMDNFLRDYRGSVWGKQGPDLMTRVYGRKCGGTTRRSSWCKEVVVGGADSVYPFPWKKTWDMLKDGADKFPKDYADIVRKAPAVHWWSHVWGRHRLKEGSFLADLLSEGCPACYPYFLQHK